MAKWRELLPLLILLGATALVLSVLGPTAWVVLLTDGSLPVVLIAAACGWGAWPTVWLGHGARPGHYQSPSASEGQRSGALQICIATALGLGIVGLLTLVLGVAGALARGTAWGLVVVGIGLGIARIYVVRRSRAEKMPTPAFPLPGGESLAARALLVLPLAVPLAVALFGACLPPGVLWNGEARGYDVLEYHLQVPREYFDAGRIAFLPHNVYASFPQQMEMLYLLLMHLAGGPLAAAIPAQLLHVTLGILAVLALMAWTPAGWPRLVVAVAAGSVPWLAYLGCLAYVELGMLFFAAVAGGMVVEHCSRSSGTREVGRYITAGLCAGLAGGCKYTGLVLVGAALALTLFSVVRGGLRARLKQVGWFVAGLVVAFSPWLARNAAFTGNPIYPFGYRWFDGRDWSTAQEEQWVRGTSLPVEDRPIGRRLAITWDEILSSQMFGPALFVLVIVAFILSRSRATAALVLWFLLILLGWAALSRMPGRFVVPIVVPLALLIGQGVEAAKPRRWRLGLLGLVALVGAVLNDRTLGRELYRDNRIWASYGAPLRMLLGGTEGFAREQGLNRLLPPTGRVWLIGEARALYLPARVHYTVVFNRDPWLEFARQARSAESVAWLRTHAVAHVVFCWPEIERLKGSYGFPTWVTRPWVESLVPAGLRRRDLTGEPAGGDIDVYEVLPE